MERIDIRYTAEGQNIRIFSINNYGEVLLEINDQPYKAFNSVKSAERWLKKHNNGRA